MIIIPDNEIQITAIRAQGAGGQNVNKVSTAIHLRYDIHNSSLPAAIKDKLLALGDYRISRAGIIIIKAQRFRTQEKNRQDALERLYQLIARVSRVPKKRRATKPSKASVQRRLESKAIRARHKQNRSKKIID